VGGDVLGSGKQCPIARFGVLTTALLKIKDVVGYYAGVLVNKAVIFRVTHSEKNNFVLSCKRRHYDALRGP
jgi:hypothetical protein